MEALGLLCTEYIHLSVPNTKVMINTIYRRVLSREQVQEVKEGIRAKKIMEELVEMCDRESICQRDSVYKALNPDTYDGKKCHHRCVLDAAVRLLQLYSVQFTWNTIWQPESCFA